MDDDDDEEEDDVSDKEESDTDGSADGPENGKYFKLYSIDFYERSIMSVVESSL